LEPERLSTIGVLDSNPASAFIWYLCHAYRARLNSLNRDPEVIEDAVACAAASLGWNPA
jgi:hypothetical protein